MMRRRLIATAGLAGTSLGSLAMADVLDRRRVKADPEWERLQAPPEGRQLTIAGAGGTQLNAEVYGAEDAPTIVLVHGWICALRFWRLQVQDLMQDHRVVTFDLRGHGDSEDPPDGDWSLDTLADDLEAVFDACVTDGKPVVLAGHSLGAMTIAAWGGRHPDAVKRRAHAVALINTGLGDLITESLLVRMPDALGRARQLIGTTILGAAAPLPKRPSPISHRLVRAIALSPSASPAAVRFSEGMVLSAQPGVRAALGREMSGMNLLDRIEHLTVPALVIAGECDKLTPPAHSHRLAEALPESKGVIELAGSGHMSPLERADEVSAALRDLVAG